MRPQTSKSGETGMSLVSVLVAVAITGLLAVVISTMTENAMFAQRSVEYRVDKDALRTMLLRSTSCSDTLPAGTCTNGNAVSLRRRLTNGTVQTLVADTGTTFGAYTVRADCAASGEGIVVRAARLAPSGTITSTSDSHFRRDPLTKKIVKWTDSESLVFAPGVELCPRQNGGTVKVFSGTNEATTCSTPNGATNIHCVNQFFVDIAFPTAFARPPQVLASLNRANSNAQSCGGGTSDRDFVGVSDINEIGFRLWCSSSPNDGGQCLDWGNLGGRLVKSTCSWMAVGE